MPASAPTSAQPALLVYGNSWALQELPRRPAQVTWSFAEALARLKNAGYDGCQAPASEAALIRRHGLRFAACARFNTPTEAAHEIGAAAEAGADCLTAHVGWGHEDDAEADELVASALQIAGEHAMPLFFETHRATLFEGQRRILQLLARHPALRLNGDFSHLYCGGEIPYFGGDRALAYLDPVFARTGFIHGRVSDGQSMQCDFTDPANRPHLRWFETAWSRVFTHWKKQARPGAAAFIFAPELGPPSSGYSPSRPRLDGEREELHDRWALSLELASLARRLFALA